MQKTIDVLLPALIMLGALSIPMTFPMIPFGFQVVFFVVAGVAALSVLSIAVMLIIQNRQAKAAPTTDAPERTPVVVSQEVMIVAYNRSAGRWCEECKMHGSHHTDRHDEFAEGALEFAATHN